MRVEIVCYIWKFSLGIWKWFFGVFIYGSFIWDFMEEWKKIEDDFWFVKFYFFSLWLAYVCGGGGGEGGIVNLEFFGVWIIGIK